MAKRKETSNEVPFIAPQPVVDPHTYEGLRSVFLSIDNFKNITAKMVNISGRSIAVIGRNQAGKSSLIQALKGTLDSSSLPDIGLQEGKEEGRIIHRVAGNIEGVYHEYTLEYYFSEKKKSGELKVFDKDGNKVNSPATVIKNIIGAVAFSPTKFLSKKKEDKLKIIKELTGRGKEIDVINYDIKTKKESIKVKKETNSMFEKELMATEYTDDQKRLYSYEKPIAPIQAKIDSLKESQDTFNDVLRQRNDFANSVSNCDKEIQSSIDEHARISEEIIRLQQRQSELMLKAENAQKKKNIDLQNIAVADKWMIENPAPDIASVAEEMRVATEHNNHFKNISNLIEKHKKLHADKQAVIELEKEVDELIEKRTKIINESQLPIQGLSFTDDEILLNGLPMEEGQINTQTLWDICIDIAMAVNPHYRGVFIDDGSLFDAEHLKNTISRIEAKGGFAIIEIVDQRGGDLDVKFTEEEFK